MPLYCPTCRSAAPPGDRCPRCAAPLVTPFEAAALESAAREAPPAPIAPTPAGRLAVGTVVALGTVVAAREVVLGVAGVLGGADAAPAVAKYSMVALEVLSVALGGLLAGAGRPQGALTGGAVGLVAGTLLGMVAVVAGERKPFTADDAPLLGVLTAVAAVAGQVGSKLWAPPRAIPVPEIKSRGSSVARLAAAGGRSIVPEERLDWARVAVAVPLAVLGLVGADSIRAGLKSASPGLLTMGGPSVANEASAVIGLVFVLAAGVLAGASTKRGWAHGLLAGLLVGAAGAALAATGHPAFRPAADGLLSLFQRDESRGGPVWVAAILVGVTTLAGAFGSSLLPPVVKMARRRRLLD